MCQMCEGMVETVASEISEAEADKPAVHLQFSVPGISCGSCLAKIEKSFSKYPGVTNARANLTLRRVVIDGDERVSSDAIIEHLKGLSYEAFQIDDEAAADTVHERQSKRLLRALAVAGFGASNIMLLSVSSWSGADGTTRDLFHMISGLIAIPVVAYSGQPFFSSALSALKVGRVNMDFPISLAVLLAVGMSIVQTMFSKPEAYFDAAVMLLFFLLIGRYLDQVMRARARSAVISLSKYAAKDAIQILPDGQVRAIKVDLIEPGMRLRLYAGSRVPADCTISQGVSDLDRSMVTGESEPIIVRPGDKLEAGTLNLTGPLEVIANRSADQSFLAEVRRMLSAAEQGKGKYVRIADRMAQIYTPAVLIFASIAFASWMIVTGGDWPTSIQISIAVLIVTCPCALGLAVPVAHVIAASQLFKSGLLMRDGSALERLAEIDMAVFDKTGTVTMGIKQVSAMSSLSAEHEIVLRTLAQNSSHPTAAAIVDHLGSGETVMLSDICEVPGFGVEAQWQNQLVRLGRGDWINPELTGTVFSVDGKETCSIQFSETIRSGAAACMQALKQAGKEVEILSGDEEKAVKTMANVLGVSEYQFGQTPADKLNYLKGLGLSDRKALMVGDGLNDAPALAAAHVSIAPSGAADVGRQAADFVMTRDSLEAVPYTLLMAQRTQTIVKQNFKLAFAYNCIAIPLALFGYVTPLVAALAMSASSIVVIANSLRLLKAQRTVSLVAVRLDKPAKQL